MSSADIDKTKRPKQTFIWKRKDFKSNFHRSNHEFDQSEGNKDMFAKIGLKETNSEAWNRCRRSRRLVNLTPLRLSMLEMFVV